MIGLLDVFLLLAEWAGAVSLLPLVGRRLTARTPRLIRVWVGTAILVLLVALMVEPDILSTRHPFESIFKALVLLVLVGGLVGFVASAMFGIIDSIDDSDPTTSLADVRWRLRSPLTRADDDRPTHQTSEGRASPAWTWPGPSLLLPLYHLSKVILLPLVGTRASSHVLDRGRALVSAVTLIVAVNLVLDAFSVSAPWTLLIFVPPAVVGADGLRNYLMTHPAMADRPGVPS